MKRDEKQILQIIKYTPPIVISIASLLITFFLYIDYSKTLENEKKETISDFLKKEKSKVKQSVQIGMSYIKLKESQQLELLKEELKEELKRAKTIALSIYNKHKHKKTKNQIIQLIKDSLRDVRFLNGRGYIFINQMTGVRVLHPIFPNKEGVNISKSKDINGIQRFKIVKEIVKKNKAGFASFHFFHPKNPTVERNKLLYVEHFEPYNLMFGTGEYLEDFKKEMQSSILYDFKNTKIDENRNYIILSGKGNFLTHPKKELNNKNIYKDPKLKDFIPMFKNLEKVKEIQKGYFRNNSSINPKTNRLEEKIFYAHYYKKWDWIVTTGFYQDEVSTLIESTKKKLDLKYNNYFNTIIISAIIVTIILLYISFTIARLLEKKFLKYKHKLENEIEVKTKQKNILQKAQQVAKIGHWELDLNTMEAKWSENIFKLFEVNDIPKKVGPDFLKGLVFKEDWQGFEDSLNNCIKNDIEHNSTYRIKASNKQMKWINCRGKLNENKTKISGIVQDVTDVKKAEEEQKQKDELLFQQSKLAAMGEMIGNIAHQWRQPLSTISTASSGLLIQKEMDMLSDENFEKALTNINKNVDYLSQTIDDFRDFFKPERNTNVFTTIELIEKTLNLSSSQLESKDIEIIQNIQNTRLNTLESELIQVLINIINNAKDALLNYDSKERFIFLTSNVIENKLHISILDNAGGVKEKIIGRIFEPYFTTKHQSQGTGIGLYMSQEIITKHLNGSINVKNHTFTYRNKQYKGALFEIILDIEKKVD